MASHELAKVKVKPEVAKILSKQLDLLKEISASYHAGVFTETEVISFLLAYGHSGCDQAFGDLLQPRAKLLNVMRARLERELEE